MNSNFDNRIESKVKQDLKISNDFLNIVCSCIEKTASNLENLADSSKNKNFKEYSRGYQDGINWVLELIRSTEDSSKKQ